MYSYYLAKREYDDCDVQQIINAINLLINIFFLNYHSHYQYLTLGSGAILSRFFLLSSKIFHCDDMLVCYQVSQVSNSY